MGTYDFRNETKYTLGQTLVSKVNYLGYGHFQFAVRGNLEDFYIPMTALFNKPKVLVNGKEITFESNTIAVDTTKSYTE